MAKTKKYEETPSEITSKVLKKESEFNDRNTRMDDDFDIWDMQETSATINYGNDGKKSAVSPTLRENDIHVISNEPRTFADQVHSTLSDAEMQIMVRMVENKGEDKRDDIASLERLLHYAFDMADRRLRKMLLPPLRESIIWDSIIRGWAAASVLVYKAKDRNVIFDIQRLDPRWLTYEVGGDGMLWSGYKTFRSGAALKDEWGYEAKQKTDNMVINYWRHDGDNKFANAVICGSDFVKEPTVYEMRSFPVTVVPVATRPPVSNETETQVAGYGESIFAPLREINKTRNRFATIAATHANLLAKQPVINYYDEVGQQIKTTVYLAEGVLNLPKDHNKLEAAPMKELAPTVMQILNWLNDQMERASLPHIPVGTPAPSGTLYNLVQEAGNKVFNPQLKNLTYFYQEVCRQIEEQLVDSNIEVDVKYEEKKKYFETQVTPIDLKKPHITRVEFTARTPWTQMDTYQIADMAKRLGLPDAFIHEYILKLPDPKGVGDLSAIEMAEHSPKMAMVRAIRSLMVAGRQDEAEAVMRDLYAMEASEMGQAQQPQLQSPGQAQQETPVGGTQIV